jgi:hypothetical protein
MYCGIACAGGRQAAGVRWLEVARLAQVHRSLKREAGGGSDVNLGRPYAVVKPSLAWLSA